MGERHTKQTRLHLHLCTLGILLLTGFLGCAHHIPAHKKSTVTRGVAQSDVVSREADGVFVEYRNCVLSQKRFPTLLAQDGVECNDDYLLYESSVLSPKKLDSFVKIGSFNIIRIGQSQTRFKRNDFVAKIINKWDMVTVVEIMNMGQEHLAFNQKIDLIYETATAEQQKQLESSYEMPRYLMILKELRKLDPSWSLIMSPRATGETVASYEYVGFFYRRGFVMNTKSSFCGNKRGCLAPVDLSKYGNLISRSPFVARFEVGKFKFNSVGIHTRFRVPAEDCLAREAQAPSTSTVKKKDCVDYTPEERQWVAEIKGLTQRNKINAEDARFLELRVSRQSLASEDEEFLIMGDFNLEFKNSNKKLWNFSLGHENVFVHEKTSISPVTGLSKQYDHFIIEPGQQLSRCRTDSAKSFNFILDANKPIADDPTLQPVADFLKFRKNRKQALQQYVSLLMSDLVVTSCSESGCVEAPRYTAEDKEYMICLYERNVLGGPFKNCRPVKGQQDRRDEGAEEGATSRTKPFQVYHEILSDHIPIEIDCTIH